MKRWWTLVVVVGTVTFSGCSSDNSATSQNSVTQSVCNDLVNTAPTVTANWVATAAPTPAGGTIVDGTYVLTAVTEYSGPGGSTGPTSTSTSLLLTISGNTMQQVGRIGGQERRYTTLISTSGTTLTGTDTCPEPNTLQVQYTATASELRVYSNGSAITLEQVCTKQ